MHSYELAYGSICVAAVFFFYRPTEPDAEQQRRLEEAGFVVQVRNQSLVAVRGHILRDDTPIEVLLEDYRKGKVDSMICKVPFKHEHGHLTEVVVGTIHLNNST